MSKTITQTDRDVTFLRMAFQERFNSDDPKSKIVAQSGVGAVIANGSQVISASANVFPPGIGKSSNFRNLKPDDARRYVLIEHAERAAIFKAFLSGKSMRGASIYCTRFPCHDCARAIIWSGLGRVVLASGFDGEGQWLASQRAARELLRDARVKIRYLPYPRSEM